jgi:hypothetical protein
MFPPPMKRRLSFLHFPPLGWLLLALLGAVFTSASQAAYVLTEVGSGTATLTLPPPPSASNQAMGSVSFAAITVNRSAPGFGDVTNNNPGVIEGAYYTYTFVTPSTANFDVQHTMGGLWSGWGSPGNGAFQRGPTTSSWSRALRYQHDYPGTNPTSSAPVGSTVPPNTTLDVPTAGDLLSVGVYMNAITDSIDYIFSNLTTGQTFSYTFTNAGLPTGNISFSGISFRSDTGITSFDYTYGTLAVIPEPDRLLLLGLAGMPLLLRRRR